MISHRQTPVVQYFVHLPVLLKFKTSLSVTPGLAASNPGPPIKAQGTYKGLVSLAPR